MPVFAAAVALSLTVPVHTFTPMGRPADCDGTEIASAAVQRTDSAGWLEAARCTRATAPGFDDIMDEWKLSQAAADGVSEDPDAAASALLASWGRAVQLQRGALVSHMVGLAIEARVLDDLVALAPELSHPAPVLEAVATLDAARTLPDLEVDIAYLGEAFAEAGVWGPAWTVCAQTQHLVVPRVQTALQADDPVAALKELEEGWWMRVPVLGTCTRGTVYVTRDAAEQAVANGAAIDALTDALHARSLPLPLRSSSSSSCSDSHRYR